MQLRSPALCANELLSRLKVLIALQNTVRSESLCALGLRYHDRPRTLNELNTAITAYIRNISQADLQKVFAKKINGFRPV
jgi:hypothetical protein